MQLVQHRGLSSLSSRCLGLPRLSRSVLAAQANIIDFRASLEPPRLEIHLSIAVSSRPPHHHTVVSIPPHRQSLASSGFGCSL